MPPREAHKNTCGKEIKTLKKGKCRAFCGFIALFDRVLPRTRLS
jgi:hypothetical protein